MPAYRLEQVSFAKVNSPLLRYARNVTSQDGEDGIIGRIFEIIKPESHYCVEFGAWDGQYLSNTWDLLINSDWTGCLIESNQEKFQQLLTTYAKHSNVSCINAYVKAEGGGSLDSILLTAGAPANLDLLSIDIDGMDYFIWESLTQFQPRVVVIEFNPTVPNDIIFIQEKSDLVNHGCSLLALILLAAEKGYQLVCTTKCNAFFVKQEYFIQFGIEDNSINTLHQPLYDGRIFQGYDGEIFTSGMPSLLWLGTEIDSSSFQIVPEIKRKFADSQDN